MTAHHTTLSEPWHRARLDRLEARQKESAFPAHSNERHSELSRGRTHNGAVRAAAFSGRVKGGLPDVPGLPW